MDRHLEDATKHFNHAEHHVLKLYGDCGVYISLLCSSFSEILEGTAGLCGAGSTIPGATLDLEWACLALFQKCG